MHAQQLVLVEDPNPDAPRYGTITLTIQLPTYGKPSDAVKTAQNIKQMLQTGLHSRVRVWHWTDPACRPEEVFERSYETVV